MAALYVNNNIYAPMYICTLANVFQSIRLRPSSQPYTFFFFLSFFSFETPKIPPFSTPHLDKKTTISKPSDRPLSTSRLSSSVQHLETRRYTSMICGFFSSSSFPLCNGSLLFLSPSRESSRARGIESSAPSIVECERQPVCVLFYDVGRRGAPPLPPFVSRAISPRLITIECPDSPESLLSPFLRKNPSRRAILANPASVHSWRDNARKQTRWTIISRAKTCLFFFRAHATPPT